MKTQTVVSILLVIGLLLVACSPQAQPTPPSNGDDIGGYSDLVEDLQRVGIVVEPAGDIHQDFIPVKGQVIRFGGADVQVFEFSDEASRQEFQASISKDGSTIGTTMVTWIDSPYFFADGRLIVLYVGSDPHIVQTLTGVLGEPITSPAGSDLVEMPEAVEKVIDLHAGPLGVDADEIDVVSYEPVEWSNACLGLAGPDEMCAEVITPGWIVVLMYGDQEYTFHTDQSGANIRQK